MIELIGISKSYRYQGRTIPVLSNVNLTITDGQCICFRRASGTGKTTLLNIIGGMVAPTAGQVKIDSQEITSLPQQFLSAYRRNHVGFIFQQFNLLDHFTVMENLYFPLVPTGRRLHADRHRIMNLLERLQIGHRSDFNVNFLSGGEQQRVAVARALINEPDIIIADEPFSNLDLGNAKLILDIFKELKVAGKTFVISATSFHADLEKGFVDREICEW